MDPKMKANLSSILLALAPATPAKRKRDDELEGASSPKQRKIESLTKLQLNQAGWAYGTYVRNGKPLLDFITFLDVLPQEIFTSTWCYDAELHRAMPSIRAAEEKRARASSKLTTTQKCAAIESMMKLLSSVLLDIKYKIPNQAEQMSTVVDDMHVSMTNSISQSASLLKEHITITRDKLASARALQDSLKPQEKVFMNKTIDSLTEEIERAEKLGALCGAGDANGGS